MAGQYVLAIERNWRIRKLIRANLEPLGLMVREAVGGQHDLLQLGRDRPDLILLDLDLDLPDEDVMEMLDTLHVQWAGCPVPIVVMSAEPPSRQLMQQGQIAGHLLKPFAVPSLLAQVQNALASPSAVD
jgi:DNA-binding response OmpR family regulator